MCSKFSPKVFEKVKVSLDSINSDTRYIDF